MEEENYADQAAEGREIQYCSARIMSPEIVEIVEDSKSLTSSRDVGGNDVYVAVGKNDLDVLKWALDHAVSPGARVFLVHAYPPITYIRTPVGRLSRSQLSPDQVKVYLNEEHNRRRNHLMKYIRLCNDAKVSVDTVLLESNVTAKAILELIPVLNITYLVMGTKQTSCSSEFGNKELNLSILMRLRKKMAKAEFVKKNAPDFCEVTIVHEGNKVLDCQQLKGQGQVHSSQLASSPRRPGIARDCERNFFQCVCFSGKVK